MNEQQALLILNAITTLKPNRIRQMIVHFGSAKAALAAGKSALLESGVSALAAEAVLKFPQDEFLKKEYALIAKYGAAIITAQDEDYPARLKEISDYPVVLYVHGNLKAANEPAVAIVGSRLASFYGTTTAKELAVGLAESGITVVSGLARGIDTSAHQGALKANGVTFGVLGCGLAQNYPPENEELREQIMEQGAVISEFPMMMEPLSWNFPQRNRIISGLSLGVIVVEAALKSGALITSRFALEQGREVFAVPGKIDNPTASGVHRLIKEGAKLVTCLEDVLEELKPQLKIYLKTARAKPQAATQSATDLSECEQAVVNLLGSEPISIEQLIEKAGLAVSQLMSTLLSLELKHHIKQFPGKLFARI